MAVFATIGTVGISLEAVASIDGSDRIMDTLVNILATP